MVSWVVKVASNFPHCRWFGEEESLAGCKRVFTTTASENATIVLKIPKSVYVEVMLHHVKQFEEKVDFLSKLPPFKPLSIREVRRLSPCFHLVVSS